MDEEEEATDCQTCSHSYQLFKTSEAVI